MPTPPRTSLDAIDDTIDDTISLYSESERLSPA